MLARLDEIPGVEESRVDWTGRRFLLTLEAASGRDKVAGEAAATLGKGARVLDEKEASAVLDAYRKGEAWMRAGETLRLSRYEAGVLAKRYASEAAGEIGLGEGQTRKLVEIFESELNRAFERTHAGQGIEAVPEEFEAAAKRILDASKAFLDSQQQGMLEEYLQRL